jgi:lysophospholipase L1-like esterase
MELDFPAGGKYTSLWLGVAWAFSGLLFCSFLAEGEKLFGLEWASIVWITGLGLLPAHSMREKSVVWRLLGLAWLCFGSGELIWGGYVYANNVFWAGMAGGSGTVLLSLWAFRLPRAWAQALITLLLLIVGLPIADHFIRPMPEVREPMTDFERYYSYEKAGQDPEAAVAWARYSIRKWWEYRKKAFYRDGPKELPMRFRPSTRNRLYDSEICINSLGFRGKEFSQQKTNTYRIIALGESTTFGVTVSRDHRPWPELLEERLRTLKTEKPVEVINAGFPGRTLPENVFRLKHELLALQPDMIISYHGFNGFNMLNSAIPSASGSPAPEYKPRPSRLLAAVEYHVKLSAYRRKRMAPGSPAIDFAESMKSAYADAYRELIRIARTNQIRLVLGNYSMAVNASSDPNVVEFYRGPYPAVRAQIKANEAHSVIVQALAAENPDVRFVDTQPRMDGKHRYFIDLMHFSKEGDEQMADMFFEAIKAGPGAE